jgi:hypothetical protein
MAGYICEHQLTHIVPGLEQYVTERRSIQKTLRLVDTSSGGMDELGRITLEYQLNMESMEDIIYEDNREIEKIYFDPFVKDKDVIIKVLSLIIILILEC